MLAELVARNRSTRRFRPDESLSSNDLRELVGLARLCPSGGNLQPLRFFLSTDPAMNDRIFPFLRWAGYLKDWEGPDPDQRPTAYVIILGDTKVTESFGVDHGIAAQTILLGAVERGFGGCMIGAIDREGLFRELAVPETCKILLVIALGKPAEEIVIEPMEPGGDHRYYRSPDGNHHVPKRSLDTLIERIVEPEG
ncbi:MAG: nitroreductase family protein [Planctomycetota bacterium]|jgi:nitroreductase